MRTTKKQSRCRLAVELLEVRSVLSTADCAAVLVMDPTDPNKLDDSFLSEPNSADKFTAARGFNANMSGNNFGMFAYQSSGMAASFGMTTPTGLAGREFTPFDSASPANRAGFASYSVGAPFVDAHQAIFGTSDLSYSSSRFGAFQSDFDGDTYGTTFQQIVFVDIDYDEYPHANPLAKPSTTGLGEGESHLTPNNVDHAFTSIIDYRPAPSTLTQSSLSSSLGTSLVSRNSAADIGIGGAYNPPNSGTLGSIATTTGYSSSGAASLGSASTLTSTSAANYSFNRTGDEGLVTLLASASLDNSSRTSLSLDSQHENFASFDAYFATLGATTNTAANILERQSSTLTNDLVDGQIVGRTSSSSVTNEGGMIDTESQVRPSSLISTLKSKDESVTSSTKTVLRTTDAVLDPTSEAIQQRTRRFANSQQIARQLGRNFLTEIVAGDTHFASRPVSSLESTAFDFNEGGVIEFFSQVNYVGVNASTGTGAPDVAQRLSGDIPVDGSVGRFQAFDLAAVNADQQAEPGITGEQVAQAAAVPAAGP